MVLPHEVEFEVRQALDKYESNTFVKRVTEAVIEELSKSERQDGRVESVPGAYLWHEEENDR